MSYLPTRSRVAELLSYDPGTGEFTRLRTAPGGKSNAGDKAGILNSRGYVRIRIDGAHHQAHRLAWLYMTGEWPKHEVDHINGIRHDNRIANLRDVPRCVNQQNQRAGKSRGPAATGLLGVSRIKTRFRAQITVLGKRLFLGRFDTPEEAHAAYLKAKREHHEGNTL
jgi:hypothetical protein